MRIKNAILLATTASLGLSACSTSLQTRISPAVPAEKVDASGNSDSVYSARQGIPYALPMRQYTIDVTRRLMSCGTPITLEVDGTSTPLPGYVLPTLGFELKATAKSAMVEGEQYLVDYKALRARAKSS